jgi:glyoxylate/hydroxypyruvate reductase A
MALLFYSLIDDPEAWTAAIRRLMPELEIRVWPDTGNPADIDLALVWEPEPGLLRRFPNLKAILSPGVGVEHILRDPELPPGIPIARTVDTRLSAMIVEYATLAVLRYHRSFPDYAEHQRRGEWRRLPQLEANERPVGILGMGMMGGAVARRLIRFGFPLRGWSRRRKRIAGLKSFTGEGEFTDFLGGTRILLCLLPLTPETHGILNRKTFAHLPRGAYLINLARGKHLVEADLIEALQSGQLAHATLDVFRTEPLPSSHPFWRHPRITITPHIAGYPLPEWAAPRIVENIRRALSGRPLLNPVDVKAGY